MQATLIGHGGDEPFLYVNGRRYEIERDCDPEMSLNDFLRQVLELTGTKVMCKEAGCGCCVVCAICKHPASGEVTAQPVNSCITPLYSAVGWHVVTVEGIGGAKAGYHPIQARLADNYGSQCGFCSPGFVMSMFSQLQENCRPSQAEVEHFFDGNICRCTGYRPILDAMKTFACDSENSSCIDVEDLDRGCCKAKVGKVPTSGVVPIARGWRGHKFYNPGSLGELMTLLGRVAGSSYRLVFGNTSASICRSADHYINVRNVPELYKTEQSAAGLEVGANLTLHELIGLFDKVGEATPGLRHLRQVSSLFQQVANQAVRRNACWAGNLMIKHDHWGFPSDIFVTMEASKAILKILDCTGVKEYILMDFLQLDMSGKLILSAMLPATSTDSTVFRSFKITPRVLNAHAYVTAAFNCSVDKEDDYRVTEKPSIIFGGISHKFHHATKTEDFLLNKSLLDQATVDGAAATLQSEVNPTESKTASSPQHRRQLAANLLYKFVLAAVGDAVASADVSGADVLERRLQSGQQDFEVDTQQRAPMGAAMPKLEARAQAAGEAKFVNDLPAHKNELFASFVLAEEAPASLKGFQTDEAEKVPGYVCLVTAKDLEGRYDNNYVSAFLPEAFAQKTEILASSDIKYAGQPVAIVLANTQWSADRAASLVTVDCEQTGDPITSVAEAVIKKAIVMEAPDTLIGEEDFDAALRRQRTQIEGQLSVQEQMHLSIETLTASAQPNEEGIVVHAPHQWLDDLVLTLCRILRRPANQVRVISPRIGGGFGGKMIAVDHIASAVAICADMHDRPVRMYMPLDKNLKLAMKRPGILFKYKAGVDADNKLGAVEWHMYHDVGHAINFQSTIPDDIKITLDMGYRCPNYRIRVTHVRTDKPESTFVRGPGPIVAAVANLWLMDHMAAQLGVDPIEFKFQHLYNEGDIGINGRKRTNDNFRRMWAEILETAEVAKRRREIAEFNQANRFRKRGLDMSASSYELESNRGRPSQVFLAVQSSDGSVTLTHSGAEMGQGLGVKCAQAVAGVLGIDIGLVKLKPTDSHVLPNIEVTGGSVSSELATMAAVDAAENLQRKLRPIREAEPAAAWKDVLAKALAAGISLTAIGKCSTGIEGKPPGCYPTTGVGVVEAEVDILTGEYEIRRADILMDLGKSLNPGVDIGQIEGAFVMGLGYFLMERTLYDQDSGRHLTAGTWNYKVPQAADVPRDMRVSILKQTQGNPLGVLSTKAVGEPPICLSALCITAIKRAVEAFREQQGKPRKFLAFDLPLTPEKVLQLSEVAPADKLVRQK